MPAASGHHAGYSIFGLAIIALAGGIYLNQVLVAGIKANNALHTAPAVTINAVYRRTKHWPQDERDSLLNDSERSYARTADFKFRLISVDPPAHRALYSVMFGKRTLRINIPEQM